ncbi:MAG: phospholipase D-like domain-containing protein [Gemmatimonadaceae bacterium]
MVVLVDITASLHALLHKRDTRAAIGWVGLIWLAPVAGVLLYALFGLNRIKRQATDIQRARARVASQQMRADAEPWLAAHARPRLAGLARLTEQLTGRPLLGGNSIEPLRNGDEAYPAMLAAIDGARSSVALCSYIFANDATGAQFVDALSRAVQRGVEVRVLIDDVGMRYSLRPIHGALKRAGVRVGRFLPIVSKTGIAFFNLRTHRKVLVVDGRTAFAGGLNIQASNVTASKPRHPIRDVHFRIRGPVVHQLMDAFAEDWVFVSGEMLEGSTWYGPVELRGTIAARAITDGPDRDLEIVRNVLLGALSSARDSVTIVTPYFLPDSPTVAALSVAALRGIRIDIVLPAAGNVGLAQWASRAMLWQILKPGCRVHLSPAPFDHAKLLVVDRSWALIGTTNWDPRSLRLNFELNIECYDEQFALTVQQLIDERIAGSRPYTLADADGRSFPARVRDGVARLLSPYL